MANTSELEVLKGDATVRLASTASMGLHPIRYHLRGRSYQSRPVPDEFYSRTGMGILVLGVIEHAEGPVAQVYCFGRGGGQPEWVKKDEARVLGSMLGRSLDELDIGAVNIDVDDSLIENTCNYYLNLGRDGHQESLLAGLGRQAKIRLPYRGPSEVHYLTPSLWEMVNQFFLGRKI